MKMFRKIIHKLTLFHRVQESWKSKNQLWKVLFRIWLHNEFHKCCHFAMYSHNKAKNGLSKGSFRGAGMPLTDVLFLQTNYLLKWPSFSARCIALWVNNSTLIFRWINIISFSVIYFILCQFHGMKYCISFFLYYYNNPISIVSKYKCLICITV